MFSVSGDLLTANEAAEALFGHGLALLARKRLVQGAADTPLAVLLDRARTADTPVRERRLEISLPGHPVIEVEATATPLPQGPILLSLTVRAPPTGFDRSTDLRSVAGMGRTLAHEIKNPLAGIRGAAQLLKTGAPPDDAALAQLIVDETDRIKRLVDRVEAFSDDRQIEHRPVNIHAVLDRVRALIASGVGAGMTLKESYDPSLPPVWGDEDQLIQIFLNLAKNAAEAAHSRGDDRGEITISTAYRHGVRLRSPGGRDPRGAPLEVKVQDNGPGVPLDLREYLFDPFVTTKPQGSGLGLTLVAKLVADHDGMIDFDSEPGRTVFRVRLPVQPPETPDHTTQEPAT
ncbi:MAG TPA: ATP-binding protein [Caulobacteraceae bacterium]|nr:ATP-binding protein [Caulobacteraceae bacterium]